MTYKTSKYNEVYIMYKEDSCIEEINEAINVVNGRIRDGKGHTHIEWLNEDDDIVFKTYVN